MSDERDGNEEILLSLASDHQLLKELLGRFDHTLFCGVKIGVSGKERSIRIRRWKGTAHYLLGLAQDVAAYIMDELRFDEEPMYIGENEFESTSFGDVLDNSYEDEDDLDDDEDETYA